MADLSKIKKLAKEKKIPLKDIALKVGITPVALSYLMKSNITSISNLEKIAEVLGVSPAVFFDNTSTSTGDVINTSVKGDNSSAIGKQVVNDDHKEEIERLEKALAKSQEQIDRLLTLLEKNSAFS